MEYYTEISLLLSLAYGQKQSSTKDHVGLYFFTYDGIYIYWSKILTAGLSFLLVSLVSHIRKGRPDAILPNTFKDIHIIEP